MIYHAFLDGKGVYQQLADYSITDTVTPLIPGTSPGVPGFDFSVPDTTDRPHRYIRTRGVLDAEVPIVGTVTNTSRDKANKITSYSFDSDLQQLNRVMRTYRQFLNYSLLSVIESTIITALPPEINVSVTGNSYVQSLRIYVPDVYENGLDSLTSILAANQLEMHTHYTYDPDANSSTLNVEIREPFTHELFFRSPMSFTESSEDSSRSSTVSVSNYDYHYADNDILWQSDSVIQIAADEYQELRVTMNATPEYLSQPICVSSMISDNIEITAPSRYVVTGSDGFIVSPSFWSLSGGRITVEQDPEAPKELIVRIFGPHDISRSPYRISEGEADRPALAISGNGVVENLKTEILYTDDSVAPNEETALDSPMISNGDQAATIATALIHSAGRPRQTISVTIPKNDFSKYYKLIKRETIRWDTILPHQIASGGRKKGSGEGFYAPHGLRFEPEGVIFRVPPSAASNSDLLCADPGMQYEGIEQRFSLTGSTLPNKRKSEQFLWLNPVLGNTAYSMGASARVLNWTANITTRLGIKWYDDNLDFITQTIISRTFTGTWNSQVMENVISPSNASFASVNILGAGTLAGGEIQVRGMSFTQGVSAIDPVAQEVVEPEEEIETNFSNIPGSLIFYNDCYYRVTEATYTEYDVSIVAEEHTRFEDINKRWAGMTWAQIDAAWAAKGSYLQWGQAPL